MNRIPGIVESIVRDELFAQVTVVYKDIKLTSCVLTSDADLPYCHCNAHVVMLFKETDTIIALDSSTIVSCRNRFAVTVRDVSMSNVMACVKCDFNDIPLSSMITRASCQAFGITKGLKVWFLVKSTSMTIAMRS